VRIDADTEGVLGMFPSRILKKIADCDAFVPDLTFISVTIPGNSCLSRM
jgi:hypothetical protein